MAISNTENSTNRPTHYARYKMSGTRDDYRSIVAISPKKGWPRARIKARQFHSTC